MTSADRPFTESERAFLEAIRDWGKKVVVVVNKVDILETGTERAQVVAFVTENARALLGVTSPIFPVSARQALRAKTGATATAAGDGGFSALEAHVRAILEERERVRLKLLNPLGVGARLARDQLAVVGERLDLLKEDFETVDRLDLQLDLYGQDRKRDFRFRLADVDRELLEFERRGADFLDRTIRVSRIFDLLNRSRVELAFQQEVLLDLPRQVEKWVEEVIDWMVASDLSHWRGVMEHLDARRLRHADRMVGHVHGALEGYDHVAEAGRRGGQVRAAVAGTAFLQVSALGLGALVTALATTSLGDATGLLAAGTLSVVGLLGLPARRSAAKRELRQKVEGLRTRVVSALDEEFTREADRSLVRIREAVAPYPRFVRGERERLDAVRAELQRIGDGLSRLRSRLEAL